MNHKQRMRIMPLFLFIYVLGMFGMFVANYYLVGILSSVTWAGWNLYNIKKTGEETERRIKYLVDNHYR